MTQGQAALLVFVGFVVLGAIAYFWMSGGLQDFYHLFTIETVYVSGVGKELNVDHPYRVEMLLEGDSNVISFSPQTKVVKVDIRGESNIITLCEGVHDPRIETFGLENDIQFLECN